MRHNEICSAYFRLDALMTVQILQFGARQLERSDWSATQTAFDTLAPCQGSAQTL
jgi:hypothetical protein